MESFQFFQIYLKDGNSYPIVVDSISYNEENGFALCNHERNEEGTKIRQHPQDVNSVIEIDGEKMYLNFDDIAAVIPTKLFCNPTLKIYIKNHGFVALKAIRYVKDNSDFIKLYDNLDNDENNIKDVYISKSEVSTIFPLA